jgi:hypothetical protein
MTMSKNELTQSLLGLVIPEPPSVEALAKLTDDERESINHWAGTCHAEASDNDVRASAAPDCLLPLLPENHYLRTWRR